MLKRVHDTPLSERFLTARDNRQPRMDETMSYWGIQALLSTLFPINMMCKNDLTLRTLSLNENSGGFHLKKFEDYIEYARDESRPFIAFTVVSGSGGEHAVAMKFNPRTNVLEYQDPWGDPLPEFLRLFFDREGFDDIEVFDHGVKQQDDYSSCAYITFYNLLCFVHDEPITEHIDVYALRQNMNAILDQQIDDIPDSRLSPSLMRETLWVSAG